MCWHDSCFTMERREYNDLMRYVVKYGKIPPSGVSRNHHNDLHFIYERIRLLMTIVKLKAFYGSTDFPHSYIRLKPVAALAVAL